ncbi:MAG TPA: ABC transporter substrate-binding protein [Myxococcaceae bacterium]|nr:ABC transporter substrate-binding protein [Myxococcaceae bacterium]
MSTRPLIAVLSLLVLLPMVGALQGCRQARGARDAQGRCVPTPGQVRLSVPSLPNTLDWSRSREQSAGNYPVIQAMMRGLTRLEPGTHAPVPDLAERWEVTPDEAGRPVYRFHLREGLRWSDGVHPLRARDFVMGWKRALLGYEPAALLDLEGAAEVLAAREDLDAPAEVREARIVAALEGLGVREVSPRVLEVRLAGPRSHFLSRLATSYVFYPVPSFDLLDRSEQEIQRYFDEPDGQRPHVLGRFRVTSYDRVAQVLRMEANPHWEGAPAGVERLVLVQAELAQLLYGQCKLDFLFLDDLRALPSVPPEERHRAELLSVYWLGMNTRTLSLPLRKAIGAALEPKALTGALIPDVRVARTLLPPELPGGVAPGAPGTEGFPRFDPERARHWVAQAPDAERTLTLLVRGGGTFLPELSLADGVRRQLAAIGLRVEVVATSSFAADIRAPDGRIRHDLFLRRTGADYAHPQTFFTLFAPGGTHFTEWHLLEEGRAIRRFQTALEAIAEQETEQARTLAATRAQTMLLDTHAVAVPLFFPDRYFQRRSHVQGLSVDPFNFLTFRTLRLEGADP